jgi:septal ring factor EnvC (AmiA/AmiB activator)
MATRTTSPLFLFRLVVAFLPVGAGLPFPSAAQQGDISREIQDSRRRLEQIQEERNGLELEMESVRSRVQTVSAALSNVERRLSGSRSVLAEIQFQSDAVGNRIATNNLERVRTGERLRERNATLQRRLRDIYQMGSLHTVRVLLGADSFTDLLNRYRYLSLIATQDRSLVDRVAQLADELLVHDMQLRQDFTELGSLRQSRVGEVAELRSIEDEHQRTLKRFRGRERQALSRLQQLEADEGRMRGLIDDLERRRLEDERRRVATGASFAPTMLATDAGSLDWPVEGSLVYSFGRERRPNGTILRWNGIGIGTTAGTPVRAVKEGTVVLAGPFEGYGPSVVLSHGDGFYTLYLYLQDVGVVEGRRIKAGQVVGTVGGTDTPEGPHVEFQVRAPRDGRSPQAQDPLHWLRERTGSR